MNNHKTINIMLDFLVGVRSNIINNHRVGWYQLLIKPLISDGINNHESKNTDVYGPVGLLSHE